MEILDIGLTSYSDALAIQEQVHQQVLSGEKSDVLILCEHPHVYTFGKSADHNNLLINESFLNKIKAEVYHTERGGDITYHGPGQLVGYPIINLRAHDWGVRVYVEYLEEALMHALSVLGISAYQIPKLTGIWVGEEDETQRKIGAIGIRVKQGVSMHGFALNVNTDLSYFSHIVPCGITDKSVTSIQQELGSDLWSEYKREFIRAFEARLMS